MHASFVILTCPRSGSTWLSTALSSHPQVHTYGGVFIERDRGDRRPLPEDRFPPGGRFYEWRAAGGRSVAGYLDALYGSKTGMSTGFKLMYGQVRLRPGVPLYLLRKRVRVVHLVRHDLLDAIISEETARARGWWHSDAVGPRAENRPVMLDPQVVVAALRQRRRAIHQVRRALALSHQPTHEVGYEELRDDPARGFAALARFLGVDPQADFSSPLERINRFGKEAMVQNYTEVRTALESTEFARYAS
jgi:Sulfotransferase domain